MASTNNPFPFLEPGYDLIHGEFDPGHLVEEMEKALKFPDSAVRGKALDWILKTCQLWLQEENHAAPERIIVFLLKDGVFQGITQAAKDDNDSRIRTKAIRTLLAVYKQNDVVETLVDAFGDPDPEVRELALCSLPQVGDDKAHKVVCAIIQVFKDPKGRATPKVIVAACGALQRTTVDAAGEAVPALVGALHNADVTVRTQVLSTLAWLGEEARTAVTDIINCLINDSDEEVCKKTALALCAVDPNYENAMPIFEKNVKLVDRDKVINALRRDGARSGPLRRKIEDAWRKTLISTDQPATNSTPSPKKYEFMLINGDWRITYDDEPIPLNKYKGFFYVKILLQHPRKEFSPTQLRLTFAIYDGTYLKSTKRQATKAGKDHGSESSELEEELDRNEYYERSQVDNEGFGSGTSDLGDEVDPEGRKQIAQRLVVVEQDLKDSRKSEEEVAELLSEQSYLIALTKHFGPDGRPHKIKRTSKLDRDVVRNSINNALERIQNTSNNLYQHLKNSLKMNKPLYSYEPEYPVDWRF